MIEKITEIAVAMRKEADKHWRAGEYDQAAVLARYSDQILAELSMAVMEGTE